MKNAYITGASKGIGQAIAIALSELTEKQYLLGRDQAGLTETAAKVATHNTEPCLITGDLSDASLIPTLIERVRLTKLRPVEMSPPSTRQAIGFITIQLIQEYCIT